MLDLSKRSRSGKFRLVTKFKKEKNNKNREASSSLAAPGTCPPAALPAVLASAVQAWPGALPSWALGSPGPACPGVCP